MKLADIPALYNITHIENLDSILEKGILSHNRIKKLGLTFKRIWDEGVQETRKVKRIQGGISLHDYANLYFNPRNSMMSKIRNLNDKLCVLIVNKKIIITSGVVLSDMNAAAVLARFYELDQIDKLDRDLIFARFWTHDDPIEYDRRKKIVCAEVLVPGLVPAKLIDGVFVSCEESLEIAQNILSKYGLSDRVIINKDIYF